MVLGIGYYSHWIIFFLRVDSYSIEFLCSFTCCFEHGGKGVFRPVSVGLSKDEYGVGGLGVKGFHLVRCREGKLG